MTWSGCELVEQIPGKCSGQPVVRGTRIFPETIVQYSDRGASVDEILEDYPSLSADVIQSILSFVHSHREQLAS